MNKEMKMMKLFKMTGLLMIAAATLVSCKKYESFDKDFDYTAVYFASQKPLRTIVGYNQMQFKVGVALSGVRKNNKEEVVRYEIDPTLLTTVPGADAFTLLPAAYYSLSDPDKMVIANGAVIGDITVTLNRDLFTADPLAMANTYALPLRIVNSTTDSVLRGNSSVPAKDYTVLVVKFISPQHGTYYHKGIEEKVDAAGTVLETIRYTNKDLNRNATWDLRTLALNSVRAPGAGARSNAALSLQTAADNNVSISAISGADLVSGSGTYDSASRQYFLQYQFTQGTGASITRYSVKDTLILRQAPELDLRFEEW